MHCIVPCESRGVEDYDSVLTKSMLCIVAVGVGGLVFSTEVRLKVCNVVYPVREVESRVFDGGLTKINYGLYCTH